MTAIDQNHSNDVPLARRAATLVLMAAMLTAGMSSNGLASTESELGLVELTSRSVMVPGEYALTVTGTGGGENVVARLISGQATTSVTVVQGEDGRPRIEFPLVDPGHYMLELASSREIATFDIEVIDLAYGATTVAGAASAVVDLIDGAAHLLVEPMTLGLDSYPLELTASNEGQAGFGYSAQLVDLVEDAVVTDGGSSVPMSELVGSEVNLEPYPVYSQFVVNDLTRQLGFTVMPPATTVEALTLALDPLAVAKLPQGDLEVTIDATTTPVVPVCGGVDECDRWDLATTDVLPGRLDASGENLQSRTVLDRIAMLSFDELSARVGASQASSGPQDALLEAIDRCSNTFLLAVPDNCPKYFADAIDGEVAEVDRQLGLDGLLEEAVEYVTCGTLRYTPTSGACHDETTRLRRRVTGPAQALSAVVTATQRAPQLDESSLTIDMPWKRAAPLTATGHVLGVVYPDYYPLYFEVADALNGATVTDAGVSLPTCSLPVSGCASFRSSDPLVQPRCVGRKGETQSVENGDYSDCWQVVTTGALASPRLVSWGAGYDQVYLFMPFNYASKDLDDNADFKEGLGLKWSTPEDEFWVAPRNETISKSSYYSATYSFASAQPEGGLGPCTWLAPGTAGYIAAGNIEVDSEQQTGFYHLSVEKVTQFYGRKTLSLPRTDCFGYASSDMQLSYLDIMTELRPSDGQLDGGVMNLNAAYGHAIGGVKVTGFSCSVGVSGRTPGAACALEGEYVEDKEVWHNRVEGTIG